YPPWQLSKAAKSAWHASVRAVGAVYLQGRVLSRARTRSHAGDIHPFLARRRRREDRGRQKRPRTRDIRADASEVTRERAAEAASGTRRGFQESRDPHEVGFGRLARR